MTREGYEPLTKSARGREGEMRPEVAKATEHLIGTIKAVKEKYGLTDTELEEVVRRASGDGGCRTLTAQGGPL